MKHVIIGSIIVFHVSLDNSPKLLQIFLIWYLTQVATLIRIELSKLKKNSPERDSSLTALGLLAQKAKLSEISLSLGARMLKHVSVATEESAHVMKSQMIWAASGNLRYLVIYIDE